MKTACWVLWAAFLVGHISLGSAIQCYICSWSPDDKNNRTDFCRDSEFDKNKLFFDDCELGCEVYIQWDKNDRMEHIRRNCLQKDFNYSDECRKGQTIGWISKRCICKADFCNNAYLSDSPSIKPLSVVMSAIVFLSFVVTLEVSGV